MAATGNIASDVEAIRALMLPGSYSTLFRQWPWAPPCSEDVLMRANAENAGLPEEVSELFRITESFTAGYFQLAEPLDSIMDAAWLTESAYEMVGEPPNGKLFWLNEAEPPRSLIEIGGSCHGRLLSADPQVGWRTIAWSLSDAIACTRELYEAGWFQWDRCPFYVNRDEVRSIQNRAFPELKPIIDRWNCSPKIALFDDLLYEEPQQPTRG